MLLLEVVISDEAAEGGESLLAWGKGEGGSRVFLEICVLIVSLLWTEEVEN